MCFSFKGMVFRTLSENLLPPLMRIVSSLPFSLMLDFKPFTPNRITYVVQSVSW